MGESFIHTPQGKTEAEVIAEARKLYSSMNYAALEVIDTGLEDDYGENVIFHISTDVPEGENYRIKWGGSYEGIKEKGGWIDFKSKREINKD